MDADALGKPSEEAERGDVLEWPDMTKLVWHDDFDRIGAPDPGRWTYDLGKGPNNDGWGNGEWQTYTDNNAYISDDNSGMRRLVIPIKWHGAADDRFTSTRMLTKGRFSMQYGRLDVCAKVATTHGSWSAIWMLPDDFGQNAEDPSKRWPTAGEIDIMEHVAMDNGVVHGTIHTGAYNHIRNTQKGRWVRVDAKGQRDWHVYSMVWSPEKIVWAVDGQVYNTFRNDGRGDPQTWPFNKPFHLIFNVAVGGDWGGQQGVDYERMFKGNSEDPGNKMEVAWVYVYEL